jgi:PTS system mannose-specific IIA component
LKAAEFIVGRIDLADTISITESLDSDEIRKTIGEKIADLNKGKGVLILTPSNLSLSFLKEEKVEVLTGVNLPMIIAFVQHRSDLNLKELAEKAQKAGKVGISVAGKLLESE